MTLEEVAQALSSPDARVESGAWYENRRGIRGYRTRIRSSGHRFMVSLPHMDHAVGLVEIAAALSSPTASIILEGIYENRSGAKGYHASVVVNRQWYLVSVSDSFGAEPVRDPVEDLASTTNRHVSDQPVDQLAPDNDFIGIVGRLVEFFSGETKEGAAEYLLDQATNGFHYPTEEWTEEFFTSVLGELDEAATALRKDPDDLIDEIENIEEYYLGDEGIAGVVRDNFRLRGLMHQLFEREPSEPLGSRLKGVSFPNGIKELKAILTECRHFIVKGRGILRGLYRA